MKTTVCKTAVFLLLLSLVLTALSGCAGESDAEFLALTESLLEKSAAVNEICFGKGLAYDEKNGYTVSGYAEASEESRAKYGIQTVEELKALITAVYSVAMVDHIDRVVFNPVKEENTFLTYRRYFDAMDGEGGVALMVKKDYLPIAHGDVSYTNLRVDSLGRRRATVLVDITVTDGTSTRTYESVSLAMRREDGVWKFDTVTYASLK